MGEDHALWFEVDPEGKGEPGHLIPYCNMRGRLTARIHRPVFYEMVELGETQVIDDQAWFGISSGGVFFKMLPQEALERLSQ